MKRLGCTCHCSGCGRCFASLAAFDTHREGAFRDGSRHCADPLDLETDFAPITFEGTCQNGDSDKRGERTIWARRVDLERNLADAERLAALNAGKRSKRLKSEREVPVRPDARAALGANPQSAEVAPCI